MEKEWMEKEKNMIQMINYYLKENIWMGKRKQKNKNLYRYIIMIKIKFKLSF